MWLGGKEKHVYHPETDVRFARYVSRKKGFARYVFEEEVPLKELTMATD